MKPAHSLSQVRVAATIQAGHITEALDIDANDGLVTIGRDTRCDIAINTNFASRQHAIIDVSGSAMSIRDTSMNGTRIQNETIKQREIVVPFGTPICIGTYTIFIVRADNPPPAPPPPRHPQPSRQPLPPPVVRPRHISAEIARPANVANAAPNWAEENEVRVEVHKKLLERLDLAAIDISKKEDPTLRPKVLAALRSIVQEIGDRIPGHIDRDVLVGSLLDEAIGLGPLERFLANPNVNEIMVVDPETIFLEVGGKLIRAESRFTNDDRVRATIERIVTPLGRRIDESVPLVDARLADGSRVNAVIQPLALRGAAITIRKFAKKPFTMQRLVELGALNQRMGQLLTRSVIAKKNVIISGGTGSGKTTLLNVLAAAIPGGERIITIEDAAELQLNQPHVVSLETRPANMEGKGEYSIRDLVKNALRMRPDRIVVGECRGGEALDMLQAMNTGHDGSLTTTHANSPREAIARLETLVMMAGLDIPLRAIREQIASSIQLIVQQSRLSDGSRRVMSISEVVGTSDDGEVNVVPIFQFVRSGTGPSGEVVGQYQATGFLPTFLNDFEVMGLVRENEEYL